MYLMKTTNNAADTNETITALIEWALACSNKGAHVRCFKHLAAAFLQAGSEGPLTNDDREEVILFINDAFTPCQDRAYADGIRRAECTDMFFNAVRAQRAA